MNGLTRKSEEENQSADDHDVLPEGGQKGSEVNLQGKTHTHGQTLLFMKIHSTLAYKLSSPCTRTHTHKPNEINRYEK